MRFAGILSGPSSATQKIFSHRYRLKTCRIATVTYPAEMIELLSLTNNPTQGDKSKNMGEIFTAAPPKFAIPPNLLAARP